LKIKLLYIRLLIIDLRVCFTRQKSIWFKITKNFRRIFLASKDLKEVLTKAVALVIRPLVRLWIKKGYSYKEFEEVVRWVFVSVTEFDFQIENKKQTDSRISVVTGLTRHQVHHYRSINLEESAENAKSNRSTRVITGWMSDKNFLVNKAPTELYLDEREPSFLSLVKEYGGDISYKAVLDELLERNSVSKIGDDKISLNSAGFVPEGNEAAIIEIIGHDAAALVDTLEHNLNADSDHKWYQKKVCYNKIPATWLVDFKKLSAQKANALLEELNSDLNEAPEASEDEQSYEAGIGIYYFQKDDDEA